MKKLPAFMCALALLGGSRLMTIKHATAAPTAAAAGWHLVWQDNFRKPGRPDAAKWNYEHGFVRNHELQYYRPANAVVRNDMLIIEARRQRVRNTAYRPGAKGWQNDRKWTRYTSASLTTEGKESWKYGRFEIRAKLPAGRGMWPAFWMLGTDISKVGWPRCGEIDIMEWLGRQARIIHGTVHWATKTTGHQSAYHTFKLGSSAAAKFHTYRTDWSSRHIKMYVDGKKYFTFNVDSAGKGPDNPFRKPMFLIMNLAMGGWGGPLDGHALPAKYEIKYVRVYQRNTH